MLSIDLFGQILRILGNEYDTINTIFGRIID